METVAICVDYGKLFCFLSIGVKFRAKMWRLAYFQTSTFYNQLPR